MTMDIKKVIEGIAKKHNPQVYNNLSIKNVTIVAAKDEKVKYWITITLSEPIRGSYVKNIVNNIPEYAIGLTTTVTVPIGAITTILFDALFEINDDSKVDVDGKHTTVEDCAADLLSVKKALIEDFVKTAATPTHRSAISSLLIKAKINVVTRDVFKADGKIKALFSLNGKENEIERDSVWADVYGLTGIRTSKIVDVYKSFCTDAAPKTTVVAPENPIAALLAKLGSTSTTADIAASALQ